MVRIVAVIKPTKKNKELVKKRGLFSDDGQWYFDLFEAFYNNEKYEIENTKENEYKFEELEKIGLTW